MGHDYPEYHSGYTKRHLDGSILHPQAQETQSYCKRKAGIRVQTLDCSFDAREQM